MRINSSELHRLALLEALLPNVPDGYYATKSAPEEPLQFFRFSTPKIGVYKDCRKIQTLHGDNLRLDLVVRGSSWTFSRYQTVDSVAIIIADYKGASMTFAKELGRCGRCGKTLTDEESRRLGIGPECILSWPWVLEEREGNS